MVDPKLIVVEQAYVYSPIRGEGVAPIVVSRQTLDPNKFRLIDRFKAKVFLHGGVDAHWEIRRRDGRSFPTAFQTPVWGGIEAVEANRVVA